MSHSLRDLGAVFISYTNGSIVERGELLAGAQGVMFRCPVGVHEPQPACTHSVIVWFNTAPAEATPLRRYFPTGTCIDDLTLTPSVHINQPTWTSRARIVRRRAATGAVGSSAGKSPLEVAAGSGTIWSRSYADSVAPVSSCRSQSP